MGLLKYIIRRLLMLVLTLIGVSLIIFAVTQTLPINRRAMLFVEDVRESGRIDDIIERYGLNKPVYIQYAIWIRELLRGNLGWSQTTIQPVLTAILRRLPATLELVLYSAPIILFLGIFLGVQSARKLGKPIDHASRTIAMVGWALPSFWLGILLLAVFYGGLGWFPPGRFGNEVNIFINAPNTPWRWYTGLLTIDALLNGQTWILADALRHLVLPIIVLTISNIAIIMEVVRSSMSKILKRKYIAVTNVKGSTKDDFLAIKHVLSNVLVQVASVSGLLFVSILTSIIIAETIFNFSGVGYLVAQAAIRLDIALIIGLLILSSCVLVIINLIVDIVYAWADTRIR